MDNDCVKYQIRVAGMSGPDGTIGARALLDLLRALTVCAERGLRLAIEGHSTKSGKLPGWLTKAVDFRLTGMERGSTVLDIEAPTLASAVGDRLRQPDFWFRTPEPEDTALTLVSRSVKDACSESLDSDFLDAGLLDGLLGFRSFLQRQTASIEMKSGDRQAENFVLSLGDMEKVRGIEIRTPEARLFLLSGTLDAIEHSRKRFSLALRDGRRLPGRIDEEFLGTEELRRFWGREVTVKGQVFFKPSGNVQLVQAQHLKEKEAGDQIFERAPAAQSEFGFVRDSTTVASAKSGWLRDVWGKWPGDEPIEELLEALKR